MRRATCATVVTLAAAGCTDRAPTAPSSPSLIVHAVLDLGSPDQYVIVQSTNGAIVDQIGVTGAAVTITPPSGVPIAATEESASGIATALPGLPSVSTVYHVPLALLGVTLVPGGTYRLRVIVPDGREVTGVTTLPSGALHTSRQASVLHRSTDTLRAAWPRIAGAAAYEVSVSSPGAGPTMKSFTDTAVVLPGTIKGLNGDFAFVVGTSSDVVVSAVDAAYYAYYRRSSDPLSGVGTMGNLHGAFGVFGAIAEVARWTVLVQ